MATPTDTFAGAPAGVPADPVAAQSSMTHRQVLQAIIGVLLASATAFLSSTIVTNALPAIVVALQGTQDQYTWVVTSTLLASTATTPLWGKLADLYSKKVLLQIAIAIITFGSAAAGFSWSMDSLIVWRTVQGVGMGGLQALMVIVIAAMISPRERGRYTGLMSTTMTVATVGGPLLGGLIVDTSWLGWRWCFWIGVPLAAISLVLVQRTLKLPVVRRKVTIDWLGATLITAGVCDVLIWVTMGGKSFPWLSVVSAVFLGAGVLLLALAVWVESRAAEPIVPLRLFRDRTVVLTTLASVAVGTAIYAGSVFFGQYFQVARGFSPTVSGLLILPMVAGSVSAATIAGLLITRSGRWKRYLVIGSVLIVAGMGLLGTVGADTHLVVLGVGMFLVGAGTGMTLQNLTLAAQNSTRASDLGAASATVSFFRSLGGTVGVAVLGTVLANQVGGLTAERLADAGLPAGAAGAGIGELSSLPPFLADVVRGAYGDAIPVVFLLVAAMGVVTVAAVSAIREVPLLRQNGVDRERAEAAAA